MREKFALCLLVCHTLLAPSELHDRGPRPRRLSRWVLSTCAPTLPPSFPHGQPEREKSGHARKVKTLLVCLNNLISLTNLFSWLFLRPVYNAVDRSLLSSSSIFATSDASYRIHLKLFTPFLNTNSTNSISVDLYNLSCKNRTDCGTKYG